MRPHKVTLKILLIFVIGCRQAPKTDLVAFELELNKQTEASIDSASKAINEHCDSLVLINAILYKDSVLQQLKPVR